VDTKDDLHLHMLGMHGTAYANYAVEDCDFIIAVGSRFDDRVAAKAELFAPLAEHVAHIDIDAAEIGKVKKVDWSHVGEAGATMAQLLAHGRKKASPRTLPAGGITAWRYGSATPCVTRKMARSFSPKR